MGMSEQGRRNVRDAHQGAAARRMGITLEQYRANLDAGLRFCHGKKHRCWLPVGAFYPSTCLSRCRECLIAQGVERKRAAAGLKDGAGI